eukprot:8362867-Pyramimonas_sp.AAC.1
MEHIAVQVQTGVAPDTAAATEAIRAVVNRANNITLTDATAILGFFVSTPDRPSQLSVDQRRELSQLVNSKVGALGNGGVAAGANKALGQKCLTIYKYLAEECEGA